MADMQVSGWMPGDHKDGLSRAAEAMVEEFERAYALGDDCKDWVIVATVSPNSVQHKANPDENPPKVGVRFRHIEMVEGAEADQVRAMLTRLREDRLGVSALPGIDEALGGMPDPDNVKDADRPKTKGKLKAVESPFDPDDTNEGDPQDPEGV